MSNEYHFVDNNEVYYNFQELQAKIANIESGNIPGVRRIMDGPPRTNNEDRILRDVKAFEEKYNREKGFEGHIRTNNSDEINNHLRQLGL